MLKTSVRHRLEEREETLSPYAARSRRSQGRVVPEEPSPLRTEFQRDRDRIIHSKAFRRLKHKTQVFIAPMGDHYVTRLTHTLEVSQIARTIARALDLNEDLTEAIALGHDLGHTPFGHVGEDELNKLYPEGFRHAEQSLRVVDVVEKDGSGLNLTWEVRQGIVSHSKPRGDFLDRTMTEGLSLEGQVVRVSDAVAYLNHDLADAFRAGVLRESGLPPEVVEVLGRRHAQRIDTMVTDIVHHSWATSGLDGPPPPGGPVITMGTAVRSAVNVLRDFMFANVYIPEDKGEQGVAARNILRLLYRRYCANPDEIPQEYRLAHGTGQRAVADWVSGMTDRYAIRVAEELKSGIAVSLHKGVS
ncbi:MAG: deoxyguanosinetriphosphate triphosphohydrolase [SAR202 cluster bacterium]|nr:deoxyguanosinetriphosphate triphosphohydrolase [SAR202 cluster bacterium]